MATAYASLLSLLHLIDQNMVSNPRQPIFLDKQLRQMESLRQKVSFLLDFLEVYSHGGSNIEAQGLESRIADAAYAVQDIIDSHVVNTILSQDPKCQPKKKKSVKRIFTSYGKCSSSNRFSQDLQKAIENLDCIRKEVMETKEKSRVKDEKPLDLVPVVSSRSIPTRKDTMLEDCNNDLEQIMDKLTGQSSNLEIISIVGMGGIGKTTLARNVYENQLVVECFPFRAWVTISQEYNLQELLLRLSQEIGLSTGGIEQESNEYHQLGDKLHQHLFGRKYMIVMDDIWSSEAWEELKRFLPDNGNGSRVMVTTRLQKVTDSFGFCDLYMNLLDENKSWSLLCREVFGRDGNCPLELVDVGKDIARNCKGLPLSIVVIGALLAKSDMTEKYWNYVAENINEIINSEDEGCWFKILKLSYSNLPIHLKPCFLHIGGYPEDSEIRVSELVKQWVGEGFLRPNEAKSLEEVAKDNLKELVERNLIFVREWGSVGKMKTCGIHDLLRDLCLKEAQKEMFLYFGKVHNHAQCVNKVRRIVFHKQWLREEGVRSDQLHLALQSTPLVHSLTCNFEPILLPASVSNLRLLNMTAHSSSTGLTSTIFQLVNLRYLRCSLLLGSSKVLSQICRLRYLQILILPGYDKEMVAPRQIWEMPQLRHITARELILPDPSESRASKHDDFVLKNLQTFLGMNFKCCEDIHKRIPNIKKLCMEYIERGTSNDYCLHNLGRLCKLQSLKCSGDRGADLLQMVVFPQSLKKLTLHLCAFHWDDITTKVGILPHLEKLRLVYCHTGEEWSLVEGKFLRLKYLELSGCHDLVWWTADGNHFPLLETLVLKSTYRLKEIPSGIGDMLQLIKLEHCTTSTEQSANEILEEQRSLGNQSLRLSVKQSNYKRLD